MFRYLTIVLCFLYTAFAFSETINNSKAVIDQYAIFSSQLENHYVSNAESRSEVENYSAPTFIEYEKTADIKYNNKMVLKNLYDTISSFDNFDIYIYYHNDKSYYYGLSIKSKLTLKIPPQSHIKIYLCGKGCSYEQKYSYVPKGIAIFYRNLATKNNRISNKLSVTNTQD